MVDTVVQDALRLAIAIPITYGASANDPVSMGQSDALLVTLCVPLLLARWRVFNRIVSVSKLPRGSDRSLRVVTLPGCSIRSLRLLIIRELVSMLLFALFAALAQAPEVAAAFAFLAGICALLGACETLLLRRPQHSPVALTRGNPWSSFISGPWVEPLTTAWLVPDAIIVGVYLAGPLVTALLTGLVFAQDVVVSVGVVRELSRAV